MDEEAPTTAVMSATCGAKEEKATKASRSIYSMAIAPKMLIEIRKNESNGYRGVYRGM